MRSCRKKIGGHPPGSPHIFCLSWRGQGTAVFACAATRDRLNHCPIDSHHTLIMALYHQQYKYMCIYSYPDRTHTQRNVSASFYSPHGVASSSTAGTSISKPVHLHSGKYMHIQTAPLDKNLHRPYTTTRTHWRDRHVEYSLDNSYSVRYHLT